MVDQRKGKEKKTVQILSQKKKSYNKPFLTDYGSIEKLTQSGGSRAKDSATTRRPG